MEDQIQKPRGSKLAATRTSKPEERDVGPVSSNSFALALALAPYHAVHIAWTCMPT